MAGGGKVTLDPETGRYTITVSKGEGTPPDSNAANPWDKVYAADEERPS